MIVVGAGIIGCAIARELAVRDVGCTVFDDRPVAGGATQASAGMLAPHVEAHAGGPMLDLSVRSLDLYDDWIGQVRRESEIDVEHGTIGTLEVALTTDRTDDLRRSGRRHGAWLDPADVARAFPELAPAAGALLTPEHGYVAAPQLATALARAAEGRGAVFRRDRVTAVTRHGSGLRVSTSAGDLDAETVVLAAGAWTNAIQGIRTPPLRPVRGQLLQLAWQDSPLSTILWGPDCYIVPRRDRTVLVGATVEDVGFDERTTPAGVSGLLDAACALVPGMHAATLLEARAGLRPATPDDLPVIGPDPIVRGLFHASGHYRNGVLLAPITAQVIADLIVEGKRDSCLGAFVPERFY